MNIVIDQSNKLISWGYCDFIAELIEGRKQIENVEVPAYDKESQDLFYLDNEVKAIDKDLDFYKQKQKSIIKQSFKNEFTTGKFLSTAIGIEVDLRRNGMDNDLENAKELLIDMTEMELTEIEYIGYSETVVITLDQLKNLIIEMRKTGFARYINKWAKEIEIDACTTKEELEFIIW